MAHGGNIADRQRQVAAAANSVADFRHATAISAAHSIVGDQYSERQIGPERLDERRDAGGRSPLALQGRQPLLQSRQLHQSPDDVMDMISHCQTASQL